MDRRKALAAAGAVSLTAAAAAAAVGANFGLFGLTDPERRSGQAEPGRRHPDPTAPGPRVALAARSADGLRRRGGDVARNGHARRTSGHVEPGAGVRDIERVPDPIGDNRGHDSSTAFADIDDRAARRPPRGFLARARAR